MGWLIGDDAIVTGALDGGITNEGGGGVSKGVATIEVSSLPASRYEASRFSLERRFWNHT